MTLGWTSGSSQGAGEMVLGSVKVMPWHSPGCSRGC